MYLVLILGLLLSGLTTGCTVYHGGVRDVTLMKDGSVQLERCDLKVYLALYGIVATDSDCTTETRTVPK